MCYFRDRFEGDRGHNVRTYRNLPEQVNDFRKKPGDREAMKNHPPHFSKCGCVKKQHKQQDFAACLLFRQ